MTQINSINDLPSKDQNAFNEIFSPVSDFADGQRDCKEGKEADMSRGKNYLSGFSTQYELEQVESAKGY